MSRRRLTRQQKARIAAIRERRLQQAQHKTDTLPDKHDETPRDGTVVVRHGRSLVIADEERHLVNCRFRQNLGDIVCGDHVIWHSTDDGDGVLHKENVAQHGVSRRWGSGEAEIVELP